MGIVRRTHVGAHRLYYGIGVVIYGAFLWALLPYLACSFILGLFLISIGFQDGIIFPLGFSFFVCLVAYCLYHCLNKVEQGPEVTRTEAREAVQRLKEKGVF